MKFIDDLTGASVAQKVDAYTARMEDVYTAMATRMLEILDKEERLRAAQARLDVALARVDAGAWETRYRRALWVASMSAAVAVASLVLAVMR